MSIWDLLLYLIAAIHLAGFCLCGYDKAASKKRNTRRISESTLMTFAAFGGAVGVYLGMLIFHHKTQHKKFMIGVPILLLIQVGLFLLLYYYVTR